MLIQSNYSLTGLNTFGIEAKAEHFVAVTSVREIRLALRRQTRPVFVLGGGSNLLITKNIPGLVLKNDIPGIEIIRNFRHRVWVAAGGGVNWHDFVQYAVGNGLGGVENLSLIPGTVGAAPVQNIGAYGVELKDVFLRLEAVDLESGRLCYFNRSQCRFGYRDSIFKREAKGKYCISKVIFSLTKNDHRLHFAYGDIRKTLEDNGVSQPGIADISRAVVQIRTAKLPDPAKIGNCGSFFKNPETERATLERIRSKYAAVPFYELPDGRVKIPAGWLIEQCGWKGKRVGNTGCYEKQALVLVNYGGASGEEVKNLAFDIIDSVESTFGIRLEAEVNLI